MTRNNQTNKKGFTLIELLVVISIIAILAVMLLGPIARARLTAKKAECADNLKKLYFALVIYDTEFKMYPRGDNFKGAGLWEALRTLPTPETAILKEKNRDSLYICPIKGQGGGIGAGICHYRGPNFDVSDGLKPSDPIGADVASNHDPRKSQEPINILYWGGQVIEAAYDSAEWKLADESLQE